ncbi:MAG: hypothetical protein Q9214_004062 [Letrouitia sp. 1 TL-2023]
MSLPTLRLTVVPTQGCSDTYHTSALSYISHKPYVPPKFSVYAGAHLSNTDNSHENERRIARVSYPCWTGHMLMRMKTQFDTDYDEVDQATQPSEYGNVTMQMVRQKGFYRQYALEELVDNGPADLLPTSLQGCIWRGTMSTIREYDKAARDSRGMCNGNLKLVRLEEPKRVLALWRNATDTKRLGDLIIHEKFDDATEDKIVQRLLVSCLGVVLFERASGRGWTGGFGKLRSKDAND